MFERLRNITVLSYAPATSDEVILRHGRIAVRVIGVGCGSGVLMLACCLEFLLSAPGWWREFWMYVLIPTTGVALLMLFPVICAYAWTREIARECASREILGFDIESVDRLVRMIALKSVAYSLAILSIARFVPRDSMWHAIFACAAAMLLLISMAWSIRAVGREQVSPADC